MGQKRETNHISAEERAKVADVANTAQKWIDESEAGEPPAAEDSAGDESSAMQTDEAPKEEKTEIKRKKKVKRTPLTVVGTTWGLNKSDMENSVQALLDLAMKDKLIADTLDRKNAVEAYVYETRDAIDMHLRPFINDDDRSVFMSALDAAEDWLYGDGENGTKSDYVKKLDELKKMGDPVELRFKEAEKRPAALAKLKKAVQDCLLFVSSEEEKYDHISAEERA